MKQIKLIISILTIFTLTSCQDVVQIKLDQGTPLITIDGFINDMRSPQTIRLTYTDNYFSQKPNDPINGASVIVKDITSGQLYNFTDNSNGNYVFNLTSSDTLGKVGHEYELTVNHQGNIYNSKSTMFRTTQVDTFIVEYKREGPILDEGYDLYFLGKEEQRRYF